MITIELHQTENTLASTLTVAKDTDGLVRIIDTFREGVALVGGGEVMHVDSLAIPSCALPALISALEKLR